MVPNDCQVVGVAGHRLKSFTHAQTDWSVRAMRTTLDKLVAEHNATVLNSGMAIGAELWGARAGLDLGMELHAWLPFPDQEANWSPEEQFVYRSTLAKASEIHLAVNELAADRQTRSLDMLTGFHERNEMLVAQSDVVVVVSNRRSYGGSAHVLSECVRLRREVVLLDPKRQTITVPSLDQVAAWMGIDRELAVA